MGSIFGYGVAGKHGDPFYSMDKAIPTLNSATYGAYVGLYYSITYAPALLFMGHLTE